MTGEANMRELQQTLTAAFGAALREALPDAMDPDPEFYTVKECAEAFNVSHGWLKKQLLQRDWKGREQDLKGLRRAIYKPGGNKLLIRRDLFAEWFESFRELSE